MYAYLIGAQCAPYRVLIELCMTNKIHFSQIMINSVEYKAIFTAYVFSNENLMQHKMESYVSVVTHKIS
jgi:hypothetical protein